MTDRAPVKDRFSSLDMLALVREVRALGPARVDKAFDDPGSDGWVLALRVRGEGKRELRIAPGRFAAVRPPGAERSEELSPLARELRRLLSGAVIVSVAEPGGERYLEVGLRRGDQPEPLTLGVELFGKGNLVIARGGTIVAVAHPKSWAHRTLRVGAAYQPPPARSNPWEYGPAELTQALTASRTDRVSTLAARLGFGGPVAEELLARAGWPGSAPAAERAPEAAAALVPVVRELLSEVGETPRGFLYRLGEVAVDVEPYRSRRFGEEPEIVADEFPTFSEAADRFFSALHPKPVVPTSEDLRRAELRRQREQQADGIARLEQEIARIRAGADAILAHYPEAEAILARAGPSEPDAAPGIEAELGGVTVRLERGRTPRASAQEMYEAMKRLQAKLEGNRAALAATDSALIRPTASAPRAPAEPKAERTRRFWFEQYRWFLSSEGILVIGGRDAASNDRIVKRYLGERDLYVHADIHGAPSVVVKRPPPGSPEPTEVTMREACLWGLAFSKAWRAGRAAGDAFWVTADQVSKTPATGEFVPRGAWVIHGTKHFERDLPMELGVGTVRYESEEPWVVAPVPALAARGRVRLILTPGEERERPAAEVEVARELGISRGLVQSLLPAGGIRYRRA